MTDYRVPTGTAGHLLIRDTGGNVEYWIECSDGATHASGLGWSGVINGQNVGGSVTLTAGFGARMVGSWYVGTPQTVSFHMNASGTSGLGGPADISQFIGRGSVPEAPHPWPVGTNGIDQITTTSMRYRFQDGSDGGSPITSRAVEFGPNPDFSGSTGWIGVDASGTFVATDLRPGSMYYMHSRVQNAVGVSPPSVVSSARTLAAAWVSDGTTWKPAAAVQVSDGTTWKPAEVLVSDGTTWKPGG